MQSPAKERQWKGATRQRVKLGKRVKPGKPYNPDIPDTHYGRDGARPSPSPRLPLSWCVAPPVYSRAARERRTNHQTT